MGKKLAHRMSKELLDESTVKEKGLTAGDFSPNWQGKIIFMNTEKSFIAHQMGVKKPGEYALKVR